ncbi:phage portal protein [Bacteroides ovatus]|nr:phage portal protein [Bacteroides ovatus]
MKFNINFNPFKKKEARQEERSYNFLSDSLFYNSATTYSESKAMLLSAVYRCVDVISDSVAQLPLEPYYVDDEGFKTKFTKHPTYWLLNREPNDQMSRFTFIKTLVTSVLLTGNGYALINRDEKGDAKELIFLKNQIQYQSLLKTVRRCTNITGMNQLVEAINMIHILNFSYDGITGISTLKHARNTLGLTADSEAHAEGFFKGGANLAGIIKVESSLTAQQKQDIKTA